MSIFVPTGFIIAGWPKCILIYLTDYTAIKPLVLKYPKYPNSLLFGLKNWYIDTCR